MPLRITCRYLQVADSRMTTAVKLVLAQAFVSGSPSLMRQLMGNGMLNSRPLAQRRPAAFGPELGAQFLLELLILADGQGPAMPDLGGGALRSLGTCITGTRRKLDGPAWDHRHGMVAWTGDRPMGEVEGEVVLRRFLKKNILIQEVGAGLIKMSYLGNAGWRSNRFSTACIAAFPSAMPFW